MPSSGYLLLRLPVWQTQSMSYTPFFATKGFVFPSGVAYLVAGLAYTNFIWRDAPSFGMKEVSNAGEKPADGICCLSVYASAGAALCIKMIAMRKV